MIKPLAPIVTFVYSRPEHTKKMIESLAKNKLAKDLEVWIFSDAAKKETAAEKVKNVREYIHSIEEKQYFKKLHIIEAQKNKGLANSVIAGVGEVINKYGKAIVVEDDLIVTDNFIEYMNEALNFYENDKRIWSISGYNLPIKIPKNYLSDVYLGYRGCSWGWATWADRWNIVDWEVKDYEIFKNDRKKRKKLNRGGKDMAQMLDMQMSGLIDSWAIRWCYEQSKREMYTIYPTKSLVYNGGLDGTGTHSGTNNEFSVELSNEKRNFIENIQLDNRIVKNFKKMYKIGWKGTLKAILLSLGLKGVVEFARTRKRS